TRPARDGPLGPAHAGPPSTEGCAAPCRAAPSTLSRLVGFRSRFADVGWASQPAWRWALPPAWLPSRAWRWAWLRSRAWRWAWLRTSPLAWPPGRPWAPG